MLKIIRLRNNAILVLAVMALFLLSGCSYSKTVQDEVSSGIVPGQHQEQSNTGRIIEEKLDAIVRGSQANQMSSNPYDYMIGSQDYDDIVMMGDEGLRYMLKKMQISREDGLREYIMAAACSSRLGEFPEFKDCSTGKEWYEGYMARRNAFSSGGSSQEIADFDHIYGSFAYPPNWPKVEILNDNHRIYWDTGDANFTGQPGGIIGNTCFGMNEEWIDILRTNIVRPGSQIEFKPAEVPGLDTPILKLQRLNQDNTTSVYPLSQNTMPVPKEEGEYIFILSVDWGKGDNNILYWFKLKVSSAQGGSAKYHCCPINLCC